MSAVPEKEGTATERTAADPHRLHAIIDQATRVAAHSLQETARSEALAPVLDRLARRAERTVRLATYEYPNDLERF